MARVLSILAAPALVLLLGCGGGGSSDTGSGQPAAADWSAVDAAVNSASSQFSGGLTVEVLTPAGVVHSVSAGGFSNTNAVLVASASKWVSATVILRLVDQGYLTLDTTTGSLLTDSGGQPWTGNLGSAKLRHLLSFTTGISGDVPASEVSTLTLDQAVKAIYADQAATASAPGSYFYYGPTHLRIAARMAEIATGKTWSQLVREQLGTPLGWPLTANFGGPNYDPAGGLYIDGQDYDRFLSLQLRKGLYGGQQLLSSSLIDQQRADAYGPSTTISYSPYVDKLGKDYHYGFGNWLETAGGGGPTPTDPVLRWSSTGTFGWAPWVAGDSVYAGV
ncbi:MAG TPA: serine hydrolase, partial [Holophagaceae bacterium]|nr:serine hydrolase [Holophagaceae bacterium]